MKPQWAWVLVAAVELCLVVLVGVWSLPTLNQASVVLLVFAVALLAVSILLLFNAAPLFTLLATGLASFLAVALAGLATGSAVFVGKPISTQVLLTAGGVALYLMLVMYVRNAWILVPAASLVNASGRLSEPPAETPHVSLWNDGFLVTERQNARVARLDEVQEGELDAVRVRAYREALAFEVPKNGTDEFKSQKEVLAKSTNPKSSDAIRSAALDVAMVGSYRSSSRYILLMKVQNQLLVLILLLLAVVAAFGILGWALPMLFGAVAALIIRVRALTPLGDPKKINGGPRWMVLFLTPLVGAVSAVIGLVLIKALEDFEILSDTITKALPVPAFDGTIPYFPASALAVAAALGWTAKLLDALMANVTALVDTKDDDPSGGGPNGGESGTGAQQSGTGGGTGGGGGTEAAGAADADADADRQAAGTKKAAKPRPKQ
jgi:hypothetical protein